VFGGPKYNAILSCCVFGFQHINFTVVVVVVVAIALKTNHDSNLRHSLKSHVITKAIETFLEYCKRRLIWYSDTLLLGRLLLPRPCVGAGDVLTLICLCLFVSRITLTVIEGLS